ncbi:hypothetical protein ACLKMY_40935, partial [Paraburkholderia mimosarum]
EITNSGANIRRVRDRIEALKKIAERTDREEEGHDYTYREDTEDNRAVFLFDAKPAKDVCDLMKRCGFVFSTTRSPVGLCAQAHGQRHQHREMAPPAARQAADWRVIAAPNRPATAGRNRQDEADAFDLFR